jgi:hypothetical protein
VDQYLKGALCFYGVLLPCSVYLCAEALLAAGFLRDAADQPKIFRLVARGQRSLPERIGWPGVAMYVFALGLINLAPLLIVVVVPLWLLVNGLPAEALTSPAAGWLALALPYVFLHGIWLATVRRAIKHSRSRNRAS